MAKFTSESDNCISNCMIGAALEGLCVGLIITNPGGKAIWMNRVAKNVLGLNGEMILGKPLSRIVRDPKLSAFWQQASEVEDTIMDEVSIHWPEAMELKISATACVSHTGELIGRALLFCDVTKDQSVRVELSRALADRLLKMVGEASIPGSPHEGLTPQELHILRLVGAGLSNQQLADELTVSLSTVRTHLKSVYRKLGLHSRPEAVSYAVRNGLA